MFLDTIWLALSTQFIYEERLCSKADCKQQKHCTRHDRFTNAIKFGFQVSQIDLPTSVELKADRITDPSK